MITVVAAAIKDHDNTIYSPDPPCRHGHIIRMMVGMGCAKPVTGEQGFRLSDGRFVSREDAVLVALHAGQIDGWRKRLYSEDLW